MSSNSVAYFGSYYGPPPVALTQSNFVQTTAHSAPLDLRTVDRCYTYGSNLPNFNDWMHFWDSNSQASDTPQSMPKRRRLSLQSDDSTPSSIMAEETPLASEISAAGFIQQTFAPSLGQLKEPSAASECKTTKALAHILQYNGNMVRKFPKKKRTPKEQERRNKNTLACRMSRCREKVQSLAIEEQHKVFTGQTFLLTREALKKAAYLNELLKYGATVKPNEHNKEISENIAKKLKLKFLENASTTETKEAPTKTTGGKRPFSVAFLLGQN